MPHSYSFEDIMRGLHEARAERVSTEPVEAWYEEGQRERWVFTFGVTYADGRRVALGTLDAMRHYDSREAFEAALKVEFAKHGVDLDKMEPKERERARTSDENIRRAALHQARLEAMARMFMQSQYFGAFTFNRFDRLPRNPADFNPAPANPERDKALATCRDLKRLRDSTTFEGERSNAQSAMDRLKAKHGIKEGEI